MKVIFLKDLRYHIFPALFIIIPLITLLSTLLSQANPPPIPPPTTIQRVVFPPSPNLLTAARSHPETCTQWISTQKSARSYLDAFIIGAQKAGTAELSGRLADIAVHKKPHDIFKEWHFFYNLDHQGQLQPHNTPDQTFVAFNSNDIPHLRLQHYLSGHPNATISTPDNLPLVDDSPIPYRLITYDPTVDYLISERNARLAQLLAPHARILVLLRDPIERAISQYISALRIANTKHPSGSVRQPDPHEFHDLIHSEIKALLQCGYDPVLASCPGDTTKLQKCVVRVGGHSRLHVFRGLYALHVETWLRYFPAHRFHFIRFSDILTKPEEQLRDVTRFLCVRSFPQESLSRYKENEGNISFGQATAMYGMEGVQDQFGGEGDSRFMADILDETRRLMENVFSGSNTKLEWLLGDKCC